MAIVLKESESINVTNVSITQNVEHITEYAHTDRGYGHYCIVQSSDKKRAAQGVTYQVDVDLQYRVQRCWKLVNCERVGLCPAFEHGHKEACKHTQEVARFYAPLLATLRSDKKNPIIEVIRKNAQGKFFRTKVRESQLSADERRAAYAQTFVY